MAMKTGLAILVISICLGAFALSAVDWLVARWVRFYTWRLPPEIRNRRREEIHSDLFEQRREDAADGYKPVDIAARILLRWMIGAPADLSWCAGQWRLCLRRREVKHNSRQSNGAEDQPRTFQVTLTAGEARPVVIARIAPPSPVAATYWSEAPLTLGLRGAVDDHSGWLHRAAVAAMLTTIRGDQFVSTSTPEATASITDTRPGTSLPVGSKVPPPS
jgi:hypothetical protein